MNIYIWLIPLITFVCVFIGVLALSRPQVKKIREEAIEEVVSEIKDELQSIKSDLGSIKDDLKNTNKEIDKLKDKDCS